MHKSIYPYGFIQEPEDRYGLAEIIQNKMAKQGNYRHV